MYQKLQTQSKRHSKKLKDNRCETDYSSGTLETY